MSQIYVFGPYNSGTNIIDKVLTRCKCINKTTSQSIFNATPKINAAPIWKHTIKKPELQKIINNPNNIVIFMYKNIYNWISSIQKSPYNIKFKNTDKREMLNNNIILAEPQFNYNHTFGNIIHLYNLYYSNYLSLLVEHPKNVIFLDYYKIINRDTSFNYLNDKLNAVHLKIVNECEFLNILSVPSKSHGLSVKNSQEAYSKYMSTNIRIKIYLLNKTKIHEYVNNNIIHYFENTEDNNVINVESSVENVEVVEVVCVELN